MGKLIKIDVIKNLDGQPSTTEWSNTYYMELTPEIETGDAAGVGIASDLFALKLQAIFFAERNIHIPAVRILRAVCTTVDTADNALPENLRVVPFGDIGRHLGEAGDEMLPLEQVLKISLSGNVGRAGANQYRGCLWESEVNLSGGAYSLKAGVSTNLGDQFTLALQGQQVTPTLRIVRFNAGVVTKRAVLSIRVVGMSNRQRTQKKRSKAPRSVNAIAKRLVTQEQELSYIGAALRVLAQNPTVSPIAKLAILSFNRLLAQPPIDTDGAAPAP